jgi:hypothetical protein
MSIISFKNKYNGGHMKLEKLNLTERTVTKDSAAKTTESGSLTTVSKLSDWVADINSKIKRAVEMKDIRTARLHLYELRGASQQMEEHIQLIAKEIGLPDLDV